ncbi:major capsid protein P2 [Vibrio sp. EJY3]|uniref:major capsid protein P2 n=1 Tax=Vibrio sp. (strain EJY3) TaxID=1116375 RepID=UPI000243B5E7|nr:major capsid protein P2 [Vibrio sp. EJY3]AEX21981.1 major phage capsid protein [Vibrio sp. EJY3]
MEALKQPFNPRPRELDPVEGVNWGNQATLRLVSGPTYQNIELVTDIADPKDIERITVKVNGREIVNVTAQDLIDLQEHKKEYVQKGRYVLNFSDMSMRTKLGIRTGELVTLQGEIWFMYIQLKAKAAGTTAPMIRARAHTTAAQAQRVYMPRIYSQTWFAASSGRTPFDFAERSATLSLKRIHLKDETIERVRVLRDEREELNVNKADNAFDLASAGREQNQGFFSVDFTRCGFGSEARLPTAAMKQLSFEVEKTAAGSIPVLIEAIEQVSVPTAQ